MALPLNKTQLIINPQEPQSTPAGTQSTPPASTTQLRQKDHNSSGYSTMVSVLPFSAAPMHSHQHSSTHVGFPPACVTQGRMTADD